MLCCLNQWLVLFLILKFGARHCRIFHKYITAYFSRLSSLEKKKSSVFAASSRSLYAPPSQFSLCSGVGLPQVPPPIRRPLATIVASSYPNEHKSNIKCSFQVLKDLRMHGATLRSLCRLVLCIPIIAFLWSNSKVLLTPFVSSAHLYIACKSLSSFSMSSGSFSVISLKQKRFLE